MRFRLSYLVGAALGAVALILQASVAFGQSGSDLVVTISPVGGSGVSAIANLTAAGNQTNITVSATGLAPGSTNETEIHFGTCANIGGIAFAFPVVVANSSGNATLSTTVNASLASLQDGNHLIHIHVASAAGAVLACGNIPVAMAAATATPAATAAATAPAVATVVAAATATPAALPVTGGPDIPLVPTLALSLGAAGLGLVLRRANRQ